jgi:cytidine deaminase
MKDEELIKIALDARRHARAPYSNFLVGAALWCGSGRIFTGCNVESSSFGLSLCAERVALTKALSEGENDFLRMAVVAEGDHPVKPCGACLQLLWDYAPNLELILSNCEKQYERIALSQLLPFPFSGNDLPDFPKNKLL